MLQIIERMCFRFSCKNNIIALAIQAYHQGLFREGSLATFIHTIKSTALSLDNVFITGSLITSCNISRF